LTLCFPVRARVKVRTASRFKTLSSHVQRVLRARWHGYRPPPVPLPRPPVPATQRIRVLVLVMGIRLGHPASRSFRQCGTQLTFGGIRISFTTRYGACLSRSGDGIRNGG
jgi:hypothetical protein